MSRDAGENKDVGLDTAISDLSLSISIFFPLFLFLSKFYEGLEDLERLHKAYPISREDAELKEKLRNDVIR